MARRFLVPLFLGTGSVLFGSHIFAGSPKSEITSAVSDSSIFKTLQNSYKDILSQLDEMKKSGNTLDNQSQVVESVCSKQLNPSVCKSLMNGNYDKFKAGTFSNEDLQKFVAQEIAKQRKNSGGAGHH
ncbi:hypothetical protein C9374_006949 [Naegleria lovaniensis]|uniref:DUF4168 domain-containing protein n=1 Tax=Naegleria lovaniensis TaxID=51637 RepID=A0AA88H2K8_NAELO|nr:uncharacterized protein C9374_006949 [Naegleria lovaniensis]KAG2393418.1 hypothetical protein C9374_006949 [Naegleria lovaniensis]